MAIGFNNVIGDVGNSISMKYERQHSVSGEIERDICNYEFGYKGEQRNC